MSLSGIDPLWSQVHALSIIAQAGSFTLAAQRLGVSKATISQRVADLEHSVGATLVHRTTRSMRLTDAGQQLVADTAESFTHIERKVGEVRDLAGQPQGVLRVTAPVALGRQHVMPHLAGFLRAYAGIRIELDLSDRVVPLAPEGFDLGLRHTSAPPDSHVAWKLCNSRTLLVASTAYLRRAGVPEHPSELAAHDCLTYLRPGPASWMFERPPRTPARSRLAEPERVRVSVRGALRTNNSELLRDAALDGLGLALLPDFSAASGLRAGRLRVLLADWSPVGVFGDAVFAIRPWSPKTPRPVRVFVDHIRQALSAGFPMEASV